MTTSDDAIKAAFASLNAPTLPRVKGKHQHNPSRRGKLRKRNKPRKMQWSHKIDGYESLNATLPIGGTGSSNGLSQAVIDGLIKTLESVISELHRRRRADVDRMDSAIAGGYPGTAGMHCANASGLMLLIEHNKGKLQRLRGMG